MAWHAACTWGLLFFRPSTAAASLPRLSTFFTGYHWFTSMRDGRGPVTELSADGARPSVNVPTPWREATSAVAEVWFGDACALYLVQHVGGSVAHTDHDLAFGYVSSAYGARTLPPATHSGGPRLWQHTSTHTHYIPFGHIWSLYHIESPNPEVEFHFLVNLFHTHRIHVWYILYMLTLGVYWW